MSAPEVDADAEEYCPECGGPVALGWVDGERVCPDGHRWTVVDGGLA